MGAATVAGHPSAGKGGHSQETQGRHLTGGLLRRPARRTDDAGLLLPKKSVRQVDHRRLPCRLQRRQLGRNGPDRERLAGRRGHGKVARPAIRRQEKTPGVGYRRRSHQDLLLRWEGTLHRQGVGEAQGGSPQPREPLREVRRHHRRGGMPKTLRERSLRRD